MVAVGAEQPEGADASDDAEDVLAQQFDQQACSMETTSLSILSVQLENPCSSYENFEGFGAAEAASDGLVYGRGLLHGERVKIHRGSSWIVYTAMPNLN